MQLPFYHHFRIKYKTSWLSREQNTLTEREREEQNSERT
jgi:hypothetical protein